MTEGVLQRAKLPQSAHADSPLTEGAEDYSGLSIYDRGHEMLCKKKSGKDDDVLGLVGVCKAAAIEFAFGGYTPPISRCETGKLFQARRTRSKEKTTRFGWSFLWLPLLGLNQRHHD